MRPSPRLSCFQGSTVAREASDKEKVESPRQPIIAPARRRCTEHTDTADVLRNHSRFLLLLISVAHIKTRVRTRGLKFQQRQSNSRRPNGPIDQTLLCERSSAPLGAGDRRRTHSSSFSCCLLYFHHPLSSPLHVTCAPHPLFFFL